MSGVHTVRQVAHLREHVAVWRRRGKRVALVPTMGALHDGHLSLVAQGLAQGCQVVATIFVNPTQFGPNDDFSRYPRQEAADAAKLAQAGAHLLFAPSVEAMYPDGFSTAVSVGGVSDGLCGAHRPGHFDGVATVVTKLLLQALPDIALFGEKDYQQLQVIKRLVRDLDIPVEIIGCATLREEDGLAMSSRNAYLSPEERAIAPALHRLMQQAAQSLRDEVPVKAVLPDTIAQIRAAGFDSVDYLELRHAESLAPLTAYAPPARLLAAARLGKTRLIDNIPV